MLFAVLRMTAGSESSDFIPCVSGFLVNMISEQKVAGVVGLCCWSDPGTAVSTRRS